MPLAVGGVQIEWRGPGGELELEIGPAGKLGYLLIQGNGASREFQEGELDSDTEALNLLGVILRPTGGA